MFYFTRVIPHREPLSPFLNDSEGEREMGEQLPRSGLCVPGILCELSCYIILTKEPPGFFIPRSISWGEPTMPDESKTTVAAFVFIEKEGSILLVKQGYGDQYWSLPGGVLEAGESVDQAAVREVEEETRLRIRLGRLIGVYSKPGENGLAITFEGFIVGGELAPDREVIEVGYFSPAKLPANVRQHLKQRVEDFLAGRPEAFIRTQ